MPDNTRYRDPNTGRWVTRESAGFLEQVLREVFQGRERAEQTLIQRGEEVSEYGGETAPEVSGSGDWEVVDYSGQGGGLMWIAEENDDGTPGVIDYGELSQTPPPWGTTTYQVRYLMPAHPNYPRGYASSGPQRVSDRWPPPENLLYNAQPLGIAAIIFRS